MLPELSIDYRTFNYIQVVNWSYKVPNKLLSKDALPAWQLLYSYKNINSRYIFLALNVTHCHVVITNIVYSTFQYLYKKCLQNICKIHKNLYVLLLICFNVFHKHLYKILFVVVNNALMTILSKTHRYADLILMNLLSSYRGI